MLRVPFATLNNPGRDLYTATIAGAHCLVTTERVSLDTVPEGYHAYDVRHTDDTHEPISVEVFVLANYFGTIISDRKIEFPSGQDYYELAEDEAEEVSFQSSERDEDNLGKSVDEGDTNRILELYLKKYPPITG